MRYRPGFVFRRALDAAREALVRLEAKQVPSQLAPAVRASGMTPPIEALLLRAIGEHAWLREKALEVWPEAAETTEGTDLASALLLTRPDGWEATVARFAWEAGQGSGAAAGARAGRDDAGLREARDEARRRLRQATAETDRLRRALKDLERSQGEPGRQERLATDRLRQELRRAEEEVRRARTEADRAVAEAGAEIARLQEALRRTREERAEALARLDESRGSAGWVGGGIELGRLLDQIAVASTRVVPDDEAVAGVEAVRLPNGVLPDSAEAMDVVLAHPGSTHLLVDGYNAGLALGSGEPGEVRDRLDGVLSRLRILARPPRSLTVVYDSAEGASVRRGPAGVAVRFTEPGVSADDVLVDLAAVPGSVVISNDREVRERATAVGALALWSDALVAWSRRR